MTWKEWYWKLSPEKRKELNKIKAQRPSYKRASLKYREKHYAYRMWYNAKQRAARAGIEFNIELEDVVVPGICPYLKAPLIITAGVGHQPFGPSLDRINPALGYTKGNTQVISKKANTMKQDATKEELLSFANSVLELYGKPVV